MKYLVCFKGQRWRKEVIEASNSFQAKVRYLALLGEFAPMAWLELLDAREAGLVGVSLDGSWQRVEEGYKEAQVFEFVPRSK